MTTESKAGLHYLLLYFIMRKQKTASQNRPLDPLLTFGLAGGMRGDVFMRLTTEQGRALFAQASQSKQGKQRGKKGRGLRFSIDEKDLAAVLCGAPEKRAIDQQSTDQSKTPQAILTQALMDRLGADVVQSEVENLIPGRKFRGDIVIASARLLIEFDGFQYHRSKTAFQKDRERQNLFVTQGWRVLRFFNKQVRDDLPGVLSQIEACIRAQSLECGQNGVIPPGIISPD